MARKSSTRLTRRQKIQQEQAVVQASNEYQAPIQMPALVPANANQKTAKQLLDSGVPVVFLTGSAGTGKSMLAAWRAAHLLKSKKIDKVYLVRPAVGVGKSIGMLPGTSDEKLAPYFAQTISHIEKFLGKGFTTYCLEKKVIELQAAEYIRGRSFENCLVICEESQGFTSSEFEMMLTRLGNGTQMIFTGDERQSDLKVITGLKTTVDLINRMLDTTPEYLDDDDLDALDSQIGIVRFVPDDCVRSGLTRAFVKTYYHTS